MPVRKQKRDNRKAPVMSEEKRRETVVTLCNLGASVIMMYQRRAPTILDQHSTYFQYRKKTKSEKQGKH